MPNDLTPFCVGDIVRAPNSFMYIVVSIDEEGMDLISLMHPDVKPHVLGNYLNRNWTTRDWNILSKINEEKRR